jgi:LPS export ABC transporter protein LptC
MTSMLRTFAAVVVAVAAAAGCRKTTQPPPTGEAAVADSAEQIMFDVHYFMTDRGVKRGDMYADTMYIFGDQTRFVLRRVRGTFTTETGAPNGTFKGDRGTFNTRTQTLEGFGNVLLTSTDGKTLASNHLKYVQSLNKVSSDSAYRLKRGADVSTGVGFDSDPNLKVFKCHSRCGGEALVPLKGLDKP